MLTSIAKVTLSLACALTVTAGAHAQGTWAGKTPAPSPIVTHAVAVADGRLYSVGGATTPACCNAFAAPTFIYDPSSDSWSRGETMTVRRKNLAAGAIGGTVYAIGGENDFTWFQTNEAYDPATNRWTTRAPMPTARAFPTAVAAGGLLYVIGGENQTGPLATVEVYDPTTNAWSAKRPMLRSRTRGHAAVAISGTIYVFGGYDTNTGRALASAEAYDIAADSWRSTADLPAPRIALASAAIEGKIYIASAVIADGVSHVDVYHPGSNSWSAATPMPSPRFLSAGGAIDGILYVVGGIASPSGTFLAAVEAFTPAPADTTPPLVRCPDEALTIVADESCHAPIPDVTTFASATDDTTPADALSKAQSPATGTDVGLGTHDVTVTVTDAAGNSTECTIVVHVVDVTAPTIASCPASSATIAAYGGAGTAVDYTSPAAIDDCSPAAVTCSVPSGSQFPVGTTTVTCVAADESGNSSSCSFNVTVRTPAGAAQILIDDVSALAGAAVLEKGEATALIAKLEAAIKSMGKGQTNAARGQLGAFVNHVEAIASSGRLPGATATALIDAATVILARLP